MAAMAFAPLDASAIIRSPISIAGNTTTNPARRTRIPAANPGECSFDSSQRCTGTSSSASASAHASAGTNGNAIL
ncbi:MAG: hypothetical protein ABIP11_02630 [Luteimonas sp.]